MAPGPSVLSTKIDQSCVTSTCTTSRLVSSGLESAARLSATCSAVTDGAGGSCTVTPTENVCEDEGVSGKGGGRTGGGEGGGRTGGAESGGSSS